MKAEFLPQAVLVFEDTGIVFPVTIHDAEVHVKALVPGSRDLRHGAHVLPHHRY
ncbi:MAG: hypothetical protein WKG07_28770 [Hymenobacter sp.]